ncbi:MAG TPA: response regulator transcription factor [Gemmatimonadaceae bacterium]|nr:response regulator transcription factor [Gemmatimonadaceae bacterium]
MTRIVLAEDHTLVRKGMRLLLETIPGLSVVGEAADGLEALQLIEEHRPDCVLMDLAMPGLSGIEAVRRASAEFPHIPVLVVSMHADEAYVHQALAAGAAGYLLKGSDKEELEIAVRTVCSGQTYLTPAISKTLVSALSRKSQPSSASSPLELLTVRQREVLRLVAEGNSTKQVAARLGLSVKTVEAHRGAIMERLGIRDLAGLVRFAVRAGLVAGDK